MNFINTFLNLDFDHYLHFDYNSYISICTKTFQNTNFCSLLGNYINNIIIVFTQIYFDIAYFVVYHIVPKTVNISNNIHSVLKYVEYFIILKHPIYLVLIIVFLLITTIHLQHHLLNVTKKELQETTIKLMAITKEHILLIKHDKPRKEKQFDVLLRQLNALCTTSNIASETINDTASTYTGTDCSVRRSQRHYRQNPKSSLDSLRHVKNENTNNNQFNVP